MTKKILIAALTAAALMAGTAQGSDGGRSTLAVSLAPDFSLPVSCPGFGLRVDSLAGRPLGTGQTCIHSSVGCEEFVPFCRETIRSTLTLDLARGSLTVPLTLREVLPSFSSFIQLGRGERLDALVDAGSDPSQRTQGEVVRREPFQVPRERTCERQKPDDDDDRRQGEDRRLLRGAGDEKAGRRHERDPEPDRKGAQQDRQCNPTSRKVAQGEKTA